MLISRYRFVKLAKWWLIISPGDSNEEDDSVQHVSEVCEREGGLRGMGPAWGSRVHAPARLRVSQEAEVRSQEARKLGSVGASNRRAGSRYGPSAGDVPLSVGRRPSFGQMTQFASRADWVIIVSKSHFILQYLIHYSVFFGFFS